MEIYVVEGIIGYYHYHLSETGKNGHPTLCGINNVMHTDIPVSSWGITSDWFPIQESYCEKCWEIYQGKIRR